MNSHGRAAADVPIINSERSFILSFVLRAQRCVDRLGIARNRNAINVKNCAALVMYHSLYYGFIVRKAAVADIINSRREFSPVFKSIDAIKGERLPVTLRGHDVKEFDSGCKCSVPYVETRPKKYQAEC